MNELVQRAKLPATWMPEEIEANRFASELLVPAQFLREDLDESDIDIEDEHQIEILAKRYKVSVLMMSIRVSKFFERDIFDVHPV